MDSQFSFKDFEKVSLKATYNMKIGNKEYVPGEIITIFDKVRIAGLDTDVKRVFAQGGFDNRIRVTWERTEDLRLQFSQGVMSKTQFALMSNSSIFSNSSAQPISITTAEEHESNENRQFTLDHVPNGEVFIYNKDTGARITQFELDNKIVTVNSPYLEVLTYYTYDYTNSSEVYKIGLNLLTGYVELEGRTRVKDDTTGQVVTGLIKIPRLKLMSDLSIRLGAQAIPLVANFSALGIPVGSRGAAYVSEFYILSDDIESDL